MKYKLKTETDKSFTLKDAISGMICECPYKSGAPIGDNMGLRGFVNQPCNSKCVMFEFNQTTSEVRLHCTGRMVDIERESNLTQFN